MESIKAGQDLEEPWDAPVNQKLTAKIPPYFCFRDSTETSIVAIRGPGTPLDPNARLRTIDIEPDTILFVDAEQSGVHWMEPGDIEISALGDLLSRRQNGMLHVAFADHQVWALDARVPTELLQQFCTSAGAAGVEREVVLAPYRLGD